MASTDDDWALGLIWKQLRGEFRSPGAVFVAAAGKLHHIGRIAEAEEMIAAAVARFPDEAGPLVERAEFAYRRREWSEAKSRFAEVSLRFPNHIMAFLGPARARNSLGELVEADRFYGEAAARFPGDANLLHEWAACAHKRGDLDEALRRWATLRERFPTHMSGRLPPAHALRDSGRLDEAETLLAEAVEQLPADHRPLVEWAELAARRPRHGDEAVRRWRLLRERFPDQPRSYVQLADTLRKRRDFAGADAELREARRRLPADRSVLHASAQLAQARGEWSEAVRLYEHLAARYPDDANYPVGVVRALLPLAGHEAASARLDKERERFPTNHNLKLLAIDAAVARADAEAAAHLWRVLKAEYPDHAAVQERLHQQQIAIIGLGLDPDAAAVAAAREASSIRDLVLQFESLGGVHEGCEFGLFQRYHGGEPLGLLRWADNRPENFLPALLADFEGVGTPEQTVLLGDSPEREYFTRDERFGMAMHTFIYVRDMPRDRMLKQVLTRLRYLKDKLIADLHAAEKIFVYKTSHRNLSDSELDGLFAALRRYGPVTLLYVRRHDADNPFPTVRWRQPGLMVGYIDGFSYLPDGSRDGHKTESWTAIVRNAYALWRGGGDVGSAT